MILNQSDSNDFVYNFQIDIKFWLSHKFNPMLNIPYLIVRLICRIWDAFYIEKTIQRCAIQRWFLFN